jgi:hypothetical protein
MICNIIETLGIVLGQSFSEVKDVRQDMLNQHDLDKFTERSATGGPSRRGWGSRRAGRGVPGDIRRPLLFPASRPDRLDGARQRV